MNRKKPIGQEYERLVDQWATAGHDEKKGMSMTWGVSYDTMKHWISDGPDEPLVCTAAVEVSPEFPYENTPTVLTTDEGIKTALVIGDMHNPYQDNQVMDVMEKVMKDIVPSYVFYNGDINDFYQVSEFSKDASRLGQLQDDIDVSRRMFGRHRGMLPSAQMFFIEGTHENRWVKYLQMKSPAVSRLDNVSVTALYHLDELAITHVPFERGILVNGTFLILHGDIASKYSSYTARLHAEKNGGSGMCNHTHRGGSYFKRDRFGTYGWWENFCLCSLNPDWTQNPNWQHGFSIVHFAPKGRFFVEQVPIVDGKCIYGGKLYQ